MPRYAISLDTDSVTELVGVGDPTDALDTLARAAGVTFDDIHVVPSTDTLFFCASVRFAFDATPGDVRAYCDYYDADYDVIESLAS
jgi:hypothetical protein